MSMCRVFSYVVGRGCLLWPVHFLGKTLLVFALLHSAFQGQTCLLLQVILDFLLLHSSPLEWKGHLFWGVSLKGLVGLHAAAKSLQSCPTLCDPIDSSPPGSPVPGIPQARTPEWVAISFSNAWKWKVKMKLLSHVRLSYPMDCSLPGSFVHGQEYCSGVPLPSPFT